MPTCAGIKKSDADEADLDRFQNLLLDTFEKNRASINHLMLDAPDNALDIAIETELLLDPNPESELIQAVAAKLV